MKAYVKEAIEFSLDSGQNAFESQEDKNFEKIHNDWRKGLDERAAKLVTTASQTLQAIVTKQSSDKTYVSTSANISVNNALNDVMWWSLGGIDNPERALEIIAAARVEYTRSLFGDLLYWLGVLKHRYSDQGFIVTHTDLIATLNARDWSNADQIARNPYLYEFVNVSPASSFYDWINFGSFDFNGRNPSAEIDPGATVMEMLDGLALTWFDAALLARPKGEAPVITLMTQVAIIRGYAERSFLSKKASKAKEINTHEKRERAVELYRSRFSQMSKAQAGVYICRELRLKEKPSTVRRWL